ncbi:hypothetical protein ABB37_05061 [Leptomonas pyrrhocoris]|uniref:Uncharacterized protein n=1 Tax=Leptomonas pyrrhocoris TaxID=157538 RepID=A0A0N1J4T1_LEPPY|nr:hypothetical protein ABB37_05061 [Leptomonas pyrrhocoris]KPA80044.1 hypothetical protein ABB37_05061 [Leptomonas pyrrhocoris]|eukprot:XP_015658483.1 hypothetical protein ABB37_05061 [Leptomonas pyrrhocoris]
MSSPLTSNNRINIPAVCRLRDVHTNETVGSGVLVGPGLLLTSSVAVPSQARAARVVATFFEGTKKTSLDVALQPQRYYFASRYPEEMDYCFVQCDEAPLLNVTPAHVALTEKGWAPVSEGDMLLIVEHPIGGGGASDGDGASLALPGSGVAAPLEKSGGGGSYPTPAASPNSNASGTMAVPYMEQKRFEEVLRCRGNLGFLKSNGNWVTAGCPAFNENGQLVGLQSQSRSDGEGVVNRVLLLTSVVKHMFANVQLPHLPQEGISFEDMWSTWYVTNDVSRIVAILANFKGKTMAQQVTCRLCELTADPNLVNSVADNGGINVILQNLSLFGNDTTLAEVGLRALWNISIGEEANLAKICEHEGVRTIVEVMEGFPSNETVLQLGAVLLHNIAGCAASPDFAHELGDRALNALYPGFQQYRESVVLQKFSLSFFATLVRLDEHFALYLIQHKIVDHLIRLIEEKPKQIFLMEMVVGLVAELAQYPKTIAVTSMNVAEYGALSMPYLIDLLIHLILEYKDLDSLMVSGNRALWGLGNLPASRATILENPRGTEALRISLPAVVARIHRQ